MKIYYEDTVIPPEEMLDIIRSKDFSRLPEYMSAAAKEAYETLLHTGDGQLCDVIVDKAALEAVYQAGAVSYTHLYWCSASSGSAGTGTFGVCKKSGERRKPE